MGILLLHVGGDGFELILVDDNGLGEDLAGDLVGCGGRLHLCGGRVVDETLLGLTIASWEQDQLGLVSHKSLSVKLELLLARGGSPVIDSNADSAGEAGAEAGSLELCESEATAISDLTGVPSGAG